MEALVIVAFIAAWAFIVWSLGYGHFGQFHGRRGTK